MMALFYLSSIFLMNKNINTLLVHLFAQHNCEAKIQDEWVIINASTPVMSMHLVEVQQQEEGFIVQIDIHAVFTKTYFIKESFTGIGNTVDTALENAISNFYFNTFPVLLTSFFQQDSTHVKKEHWQLGQKNWQVVLGQYGIRYHEKESIHVPDNIHLMLHDLLDARLTDEPHYWCSIFVHQAHEQIKQCQVLLNNEPWKEAEQRIQHLAWERKDDYYAVRHFFMLNAPKQ